MTGITGDDRGNQFDAEAASASVVLTGGEGADTLKGSRFADRLSGGTGRDVLIGGAGDDLIFFDVEDTTVRGGAGRDVGVVGDERGVDLDVADAQLEAVYGRGGEDVFDGAAAPTALLLFGGGADDTLTGGAGDDVLNGGSGGDRLTGGGGDDALHGGSYFDSLYGGDGDDKLHGGSSSADRLYGGAGNDILFADAKDTEIDGSSGYDLVDYTAETLDLDVDMSAMLVEALIGGAGDDTYTNMSHWTHPLYVDGRAGDDRMHLGAGSDRGFGGSGNDVVYARAGHDRIEGGSGDDRLLGQDGADDLYGGTGSDTLEGESGHDRLEGEENHDVLVGGDDADHLFGGSGNDDLSGGDGGDFLRGDAGDDVLTGGSGDDRFVFRKGFGDDRITNFSVGSDRIEFVETGTPREFSDLRFNDIDTETVRSDHNPDVWYSYLTGFTLICEEGSIEIAFDRIHYAVGRDVPVTNAMLADAVGDDFFHYL